MENKNLLPPFVEYGLLPNTDYELTFEQLRCSYLVCDTNQYIFDYNWRAKLVDNLEILVKELWEVGIESVFIDGSFVEAKSRPQDIDGYFEISEEFYLSGEFTSKINLINANKIWDWSTKSLITDIKTKRKKLPMWHKYKIELFPHYGQGCGVLDEFGYEFNFPSLFRKNRKGKPKGIIKLVKSYD